MRLVLRGTCPLIKLRLSSSTLTIGYSKECQLQWQSSGSDYLQLLLTQQRPYKHAHIAWESILLPEKTLALTALELHTDSSIVQLEGIEVSARFELSCAGSHNLIQLWQMTLLCFTYTVTGMQNRLSFDDRSPPIQQALLDLSRGIQNSVAALWLLASSKSTVRLKNYSSAVLQLAPDLQERQLEFERDASSEVLVQLDERTLRSVEAEYECWLVDSALISISCEQHSRPSGRLPALSLEAPSTERIVCGICLDAAPNHLFQPCGHLYFCESCCDVSMRTCPVCRQSVQALQKIFSIIGC